MDEFLYPAQTKKRNIKGHNFFLLNCIQNFIWTIKNRFQPRPPPLVNSSHPKVLLGSKLIFRDGFKLRTSQEII